MKNISKRLSILSDLEELAFYGFPDFDNAQRYQYFTFQQKELELIMSCPSFHSQVYCALQIGYFKAKNIFFNRASYEFLKEDADFLVKKYFSSWPLEEFTITKHEHYLQQKEICKLFGYKPWSNSLLSEINEYIKIIVKRDITPNFIATELLSFLKNQKIVRPGYTTLQDIVSSALTNERNRLKLQIQNLLPKGQRESFDHLLDSNSALCELASLKQDPKNFNLRVMRAECKKHLTLKPLYQIAKTVLPHLDLSQQNIAHYASLINYYSIYELKQFSSREQTYLYLLCYVFKRYQMANDTLADAFDFQIKKLEKIVKEKTNTKPHEEKFDKQIGHLLLLYVDNDLSDSITLGETRKKAFDILPKVTIQSVGERLIRKPQQHRDVQWALRDTLASQYKRHLRQLCIHTDFSSRLSSNHLLDAILWIKSVFSKKQSLLQQLPDQFPNKFISNRIRPHIMPFNSDGTQIVNANRYEILVYRQIAEQMKAGAIHIEDSIRHRTFYHELVNQQKKEAILKTLEIPWHQSSFEEQIDSLFKELHNLLCQLDYKLKKGQLKQFKYDRRKKEIVWIKPKNETNKETDFALYDKVPICDIVDVLRFVDEASGFLSVLTPLIPRYSKQKPSIEQLIAVILAQAFGIGIYKMSQTSDISYRALETTYDQYMRISTLRNAQDAISNAMTKLSIFSHYTFDVDNILYGGVDGQKYEAITPTTKSRYSRKYYKKGRGVVAYTLLSNHVPIHGEIIGAHEHESYFAFDIWYNNTSLIQPTVLTGDMHSINKANFAIFHWFGGDFRPRFTNLKKELENIFCPKDLNHYEEFIVLPAGQINKQVITNEKENLEQIIASLGSKEISQNILIKKLCSLSLSNNTRKAVFEYDKLIRSIYTIKCVIDSKILTDVHRSQNRIESYHSLRAAISRVGGRKALLGRTDIEVEISNLCGRITATAIIYYNASIQSRLYEKLSKTKGNQNRKILKYIAEKPPVAWQNIHFTGYFSFLKNKKPIDLDSIIENIEAVL